MRPLFLLLLALCACTPKGVPVDTNPTSPNVSTDTIKKQNPLTPCQTLMTVSGSEREQAETAYVLYRDAIKANNYSEALLHWRYVFNTVPGLNGKSTSHFSDGVTIFKNLYTLTTDTTLQKRYIDTVEIIYNKQKECFGNEAQVNGLLAFDYYYTFYKFVSKDKIYNLFKSNFDTKGKNADYFVINPFTKLLYDGVVDSTISITEGRKYAALIYSAVENGLSTCKGSTCESWNLINDYAPKILDGLEGIDDFYDCKYYTEKYYNVFKEHPDSCELVNLAYSRMVRGGCDPMDAKFAELKKVKSTTCYEAPPTTSCASKGNENYNNGKYTKAIESFNQCAEEAKDNETKAKYLILISKIYYRDLKNFPKARKYALDAAKVKPKWGEPYMLIGNLYASSGPLCGSGTGFESQVVTWVAIDSWNKAKLIDPSVSNEANSLINRYKQYMPKKEDIFFRSLKAGDNYFIPCWIQENTVIRTAD